MTNYDAKGNVISDAEWYAQHAARVALTGQTGSQFWMNADYTLNAQTEPPNEVKALYNDMTYVSDYTRDTISKLADKYGGLENLSPALQKTYATVPANQNPNYQILTNYAAQATAASNAGVTPVANTQVPVAATDFINTGTAAVNKAVADAESALSPWIDWLKNNMLIVIIVVAALIFVPSILRAASSGGSTYRPRRRIAYL
jgi:hypothetical protein